MVTVVRHQVAMEVTVSQELVEANIGYYPYVVASALADEIDALRDEQGLAYYPPIDYFATRGELDPDLLELDLMLSEFCIDHVKRDVRRLLSRAFSSLRIERAVACNRSMPRVRPRQEGSHLALMHHMAPNRVRIELRLSTIQHAPVEGDEGQVEQRLRYWLGDAFEEVAVTSVAAA